MADGNKKKSKSWNPTYKKKFMNSHQKVPNRYEKKAKAPANNSNSEWNLYVTEKYSPDDVTIINKLRVIESYLSLFSEKLLIDSDKNKRFIIDVEDMLDQFDMNWEGFKIELENSPEFIIGIFGLAMENQIKKNNIRDNTNSEIPVDGIIHNITKKIIPRFTGLRNILSFQDLKTYNYGKFVTMMGIVVRTSDVKPYCTEIAFMCNKCQTIQVCMQEKGCYTTPNRCIGTECFSCSFKALLKSPLTQTIPWKTVRIQELNIYQSEGGRVPRTCECELMYDLTDTCIPGDVVLMSGVISLNNANEKKTTAGKDACAYVPYLSVNSVTCLKGKNVESGGSLTDSLHFKPEDLNAIKQIHSEDNLFRLVVASLAPNIYGHELIKAGIVLGLFGGNESSKEDTLQFSTRENSHVLIVGDPGLGKSQMLLASSAVSPRGVYVCGNSTTTSGLTVTISKEAGGDNTLEAGALVLADQGHCCIDEFDKMMHQHSALLEAMEQQTISMAKSGVVCTLPARTSIIAMANPSGGHYNRSKTVSENLRIKGSLLSRFDLVFIIQDKPDQTFDSKMSEHVMGRHTDNPKNVTINEYFSKSPPSISESLLSNNGKLSKNLQFKCNEIANHIPYKLLQKYISYARKFSQPKLPPEVCTLLQNFYLEMRSHRKLNFSTPITTRQLESLVRLTKARARIELRSTCTNSDAEEVIEIMKYSMQDTFSDEFGNIDLDRSIHGSGMSKRSQAKKFMAHLTKVAVVKGDNHFHIAEMKDVASKLKISIDSFSSLLETLNDQGFLLKKGFQLYQIQTL
ncbi:hypothetical protein JTE90_008383 [Oedothorax gibbosus]|uniref:Minichromosome maintenance 8 n=1 Tax=Oedothorax gibbosus TaxID=931172 RepID=A0AAV6V372_9ARAC|nr:hypothetical protein JTE90_008383 [Oedothorax gibbosus]